MHLYFHIYFTSPGVPPHLFPSPRKSHNISFYPSGISAESTGSPLPRSSRSSLVGIGTERLCSKKNSVVTTTIQLRSDFDSTGVRLAFDMLIKGH